MVTNHLSRLERNKCKGIDDDLSIYDAFPNEQLM